MARLKDLRRRIKSVQNTRKLTRTMEMVATAKSKRAQDFFRAVRAFGDSVADALAAARTESQDPTPLERPGKGKVRGLWVVTANRGLCGGFNASVVRLAREEIARIRKGGFEPRLFVQGKKGQQAFRNLKIPFEPVSVARDDQPRLAEAEALADRWIALAQGGGLASMSSVSTPFKPGAVPAPEARALLPAEAGPPPKAKGAPIFEPTLAAALSALAPLSVACEILGRMSASAAAEQVARRVAMKSATDNADDMVKTLTRAYNRARQAGITQEIAEVVGGGMAVE